MYNVHISKYGGSCILLTDSVHSWNSCLSCSFWNQWGASSVDSVPAMGWKAQWIRGFVVQAWWPKFKSSAPTSKARCGFQCCNLTSGSGGVETGGLLAASQTPGSGRDRVSGESGEYDRQPYILSQLLHLHVCTHTWTNATYHMQFTHMHMHAQVNSFLKENLPADTGDIQY